MNKSYFVLAINNEFNEKERKEEMTSLAIKYVRPHSSERLVESIPDLYLEFANLDYDVWLKASDEMIFPHDVINNEVDKECDTVWKAKDDEDKLRELFFEWIDKVKEKGIKDIFFINLDVNDWSLFTQFLFGPFYQDAELLIKEGIDPFPVDIHTAFRLFGKDFLKEFHNTLNIFVNDNGIDLSDIKMTSLLKASLTTCTYFRNMLLPNEVPNQKE